LAWLLEGGVSFGNRYIGLSLAAWQPEGGYHLEIGILALAWQHEGRYNLEIDI
jgi:hypothetical protein